MIDKLEEIEKVRNTIESSVLPQTYKNEVLIFVDILKGMMHEMIELKTLLDELQNQLA